MERLYLSIFGGKSFSKSEQIVVVSREECNEMERSNICMSDNNRIKMSCENDLCESTSIPEVRLDANNLTKISYLLLIQKKNNI